MELDKMPENKRRRIWLRIILLGFLPVVCVIALIFWPQQEVGLILINEHLDCDIEGSHFKINKVIESNDSGLINKIVLPRFEGEREFVRRQYDSIFSQDP